MEILSLYLISQTSENKVNPNETKNKHGKNLVNNA